MWLILSFVIVSVGLWGLYQWARSGAGMWEIASIRRREKSMQDDERLMAEKEIAELDRETDRRLKFSFKIFAGLMIAVWLVLAAAIILQILGLEGWARNRLEDISMRARHYWNSGMVPGVPHETPQSTPDRNKKLREMGTNFRK